MNKNKCCPFSSSGEQYRQGWAVSFVWVYAQNTLMDKAVSIENDIEKNSERRTYYANYWYELFN